MSGSKGPSQAEVLATMATDQYTFGRSTDDYHYALPEGEARIALPLRGARSVRAALAAAYLRQEGRPAGSNALGDVMAALEGQCAAATARTLYLRVAERGGEVWLDLGRDDGRAVHLTTERWETTTDYPVTFRRTALTGVLPEPVRGGSLDELRELLNVTDEAWPLLVAWLICALDLTMPYPILALLGEQGTGKSTAAKLIASTVDASPVPLRRPPRDPDQWVTAAAGSHVVPLDNVSTIPDWLSDVLCRASTGEGDVRRSLYTNGDLYVVAFRRLVILTSIDPGAMRGDLADRLLGIDLAQIPDTKRRRDAELAEAWAAAHPRVLGALLDLAVQVRALLPSVDLASMPRMADYARTLFAVDKVLGTSGYDTYTGQRTALAAEVVAGDIVASRITTWLASRGEWVGAAGELLAALGTPDSPQDQKVWPRTPNGMGGRLRRLAPALRATGHGVVEGERVNGVRRWTLTPPVNEGCSGSPPSPPPPPDGLWPAETRGDHGGDREQASPLGGDRSPPAEHIATSSPPDGHRADQHERSASGDGGDGGDHPQAIFMCRVCGWPIDPAAAAGGFDTCPSCA